MTPISLSTTFVQHSPGVLYPAGFDYSRGGNPTRAALEGNLAALEGGKYGLCFGSGLAATAAVILSLLKPGDEVVSIDDAYGGTGRYFERIAAPITGIKFNLVDLSDVSLLEPAINERTRLVWVESPTNPTLKITDIAKVCEIAHRHNLIVVIDNTFMTPYFQNPLELGADVVVHSVTKYLNGHSDVCMGAVITSNEEIHTKIRFQQFAAGSVPSPFDCFMVLRGTKTLHLRMQRHQENAMAVAEFLSSHPKVDKVIYPGLASHPQHELAKRQARGFGGMVTVCLKGDLKEARVFMENLKIFALAESLGGVESLANHPEQMTHASVPAERRKVLGITGSMVRLSVGVESVTDLVADLEQALSKL